LKEKNNFVSVVFHKNTPFLKNINFFFDPIIVGDSKEDFDDKFHKDNVGDNISKKNFSFCEMTAVYYMWKNLNYDSYGLMHYRRIFADYEYSIKLIPYLSKSLIKKIIGRDYSFDYVVFEKVISKNKLEKVKSKITKLTKFYDIILPKKTVLNITVKDHFIKYHGTSFFKIVSEIIYSESENDYKFFIEFFNSKKMHCYNMFIMNNQYFNEYCEWVFNLLFKIEKKIDFSTLNNYDRRIIGFIAERLLNVFIYKKSKENTVKIKELSVIYNL
tara:strand:+ start:1269 stop:2084 length:816 start_codon:yes stop_codon:yes gene_type:complete